MRLPTCNLWSRHKTDDPLLSKLYLLSFSLLLFCVKGYTQESPFISLNTADGLSQNSVIDIKEDQNKFIWLATQDGLNQFDGRTFKKYHGFFRDETPETYSRLGKLFFDSNNKIWATDIEGHINVIDYTRSTSYKVHQIADASCVYELNPNSFLIGSFTEGLYKYKSTNQDTVTNSVTSPTRIFEIKKLGDQVFVCTNNGLFTFTENEDLKPNFEFFKGKNIGKIISNNRGGYFVHCFIEGLFEIEKDETISRIQSIPVGTSIQDMLLDKKNNLWIATYGSGVYQLKGKSITQFKYSSEEKNSICYNDILSIFEDSNGNIWFGSDGGGMSYIPANPNPLKVLSNTLLNSPLQVDVPRSIFADEKNIWIGTSGKGLAKINRYNFKGILYSDTPKADKFIPDSRIMSLHMTKDSSLWVGTQERGLLKIKSNGQPEFIKSKITATTIWDITNFSNTELILCTRNKGILLFNTLDYTTRPIEMPDDKFSLNKSIRTCLRSASGEHFYFGADDGHLYCLSNNSMQLEVLDLYPNLTGGIKSLYEKDNLLWVGSSRNGLFLFEPEKGIVAHYTEQQWLPNDVIYSILPDKNNFLWASTNNGLVQFSTDTTLLNQADYTPLHLDYEAGILNNEFNTGAHFIDNDGLLYFGNIDGIVWFDPNATQKNVHPAQLVLSELAVINKKGYSTTQPIYNSSKVTIEPNYRDLIINFSVPNFDAFQSYQFDYQLKDYDFQSNNIGNNQSIKLSNIPPGKYTLVINCKSTNSEALISTQSLNLILKPSLVQTKWFKILLGLLLAGILWLIYSQRISALKNKARLLSNIREAKLSALQAQINPHFIFNCLNSIDSYILNNETEKASEYLIGFSKLIRRILDYSDELHITLEEEIEVLDLYLSMEKMRFGEQIEYQIDIEKDLSKSTIQVPPLIIQPYVENAIWHGLGHKPDGGQIKISITKKEQILHIEVLDNGIGREKAKEYKTKRYDSKSMGSSLSQNRIDLLNQIPGNDTQVVIEDLYDDNQMPMGTKVTVMLKLKE